MPRLLALETSGELCSVALCDGEHFVADTRHAPRQHAQCLLPMIGELMAQAELAFTDLDGIVFGRGPGSFTGLRIAVATAQGLAFAHDLPVFPVSTLQALAWQAHQQVFARQIITLADARMGEVYWAAWDLEAGIPLARAGEQVSAPETVEVAGMADQDWLLVGSGLNYASRLPLTTLNAAQQQLAEMQPEALSMLHLALPRYAAGEGLDAAQAEAVYLRNQVVTLPSAS